jgi:Flp pilus assembly CpaE family ATPase
VHPRRYRIFIGGGLSTVALQGFDGFTIESNGVHTTLIADLDQAAVYGGAESSPVT